MTIPALPIESLSDILIFCDKNELATLSRVNSAFRDTANRYLYHSLPQDSSPYWFIRLLQSLASNPKLARYVRSFSFHLLSNQLPLLCLFALLRRCFRSMTGVVVLYLSIPSDGIHIFRGSSIHLRNHRNGLPHHLEIIFAPDNNDFRIEIHSPTSDPSIIREMVDLLDPADVNVARVHVITANVDIPALLKSLSDLPEVWLLTLTFVSFSEVSVLRTTPI
jgi:hypothetical protein